MRLPFLNRDKEKSQLSHRLESKEGVFCCLYGRRRCGKSRLLQEVLSGRQALYFVGDERESTLQREALAVMMSASVPGMHRVRYPDWASLLERWWREAVAGSILVLDEFPYLVKSSPDLPSILQRLIDQNRSRRVHLVLCGSSQQMMQGLVLDASAPLYGRAEAILEVKPMQPYWLARALGFNRPADTVDAYAVWGGVPRYWELAVDFPSTWSAVEELILEPTGVLHNEPRRLLLDDMRDTAQAASILALVGAGCNRISEIAGRLSKPATTLTRPLQRLLDLGLLHREIPFGEGERSSKRTLYRIADPFLGFWFRHVEPNRSRLEAGPLPPVSDSIQHGIHGHKSRIWEELSRRSLPLIDIGGEEWLPAQRWWGTGLEKRPLEVDVVAESFDHHSLFVGEVRLRVDAADLKRLSQEIDSKIKQLPFAQSYKAVRTGIFALECTRARQPVEVVTGEQVVSALR